jgi:hypothetical protein
MARPALSHESIRKAVDFRLTASDLSSGVIADDIYTGKAWDDAFARDPLLITYDEDSENARRVKRAVEFLVAARLALGWLGNASSERWTASGATYEIRGVSFDRTERAALLRAWAEEEFAAYLDEDGTVDFPIGFTLAHGCRGR